MRRELIFQALDCQPVSRVPVGFWFHFLPDVLTDDWRENPRLLEQNVAGHQEFIKAFKPALVKIMSDGFFFYPSPGVFQPIDLPMITAIDSDHKWLQAQVTLIRRVRSCQEDATYFYNIFSPLTSLRFKLGLERLKYFCEAQPEALGKTLSRMADGLAHLARAAVTDGGADGIYLSVQNPDLNFFSYDFYAQYAAPGEKDILKAAQSAGGRNILHICGYAGVKNRLPFYADYPFDAVNWAVNVEDIPLEKGRTIFPQKTLIGGFPNTPGSVLTDGSKEEIKAKARDLIRKAGPLGLILGADCTVPSDVPLANLDYVREAAQEAIRFGGSGVQL
ncbi:MAG: uroporphyrinogen decarboxylase [Deltaproteobacteria bacterium]|nr:uroporphyrinogen decarboxylase [Deltaproteobacteria bacterium]